MLLLNRTYINKKQKIVKWKNNEDNLLVLTRRFFCYKTKWTALCRESSLHSKQGQSTLDRAEPKGWSLADGHGQRTAVPGFLLSMKPWNKKWMNTDIQWNLLPYSANCIFWGKKVFITAVSTVSFLKLHSKNIIKSIVCTTKGLGGANCIWLYQLYLFSPFFVLFL